MERMRHHRHDAWRCSLPDWSPQRWTMARPNTKPVNDSVDGLQKYWNVPLTVKSGGDIIRAKIGEWMPDWMCRSANIWADTFPGESQLSTIASEMLSLYFIYLLSWQTYHTQYRVMVFVCFLSSKTTRPTLNATTFALQWMWCGPRQTQQPLMDRCLM